MKSKLYSLILLPVIFLGDSITKGWEANLEILDAKVDVVAKVSAPTSYGLQELPRIIKKQPRKLFVMLGINEIDDPDNILVNLEKVIATVQSQSPKTAIVLQSILPTRVKHIDNKQVIETNRRLKDLCAKYERVKFLDIYPYFLDNDGNLSKNFTDDGVHLTKNAYSLWRKLISDEL